MPLRPSPFANEEIHLRVLRLVEENPHMTQRELATALGVSVGKTNYCIKALLEKGLIKLHNFKSSRHKLGYSYLLTPSGIAEKGAIAARFLEHKMVEYAQLKTLIESLQSEMLETDVRKETQF